MSAFKSDKRTKFFEKSGLPMWDAFYEIGDKKIYYPYMLYTCQKVASTRIKAIQKASVEVALVFENVLEEIKQWKSDDLTKWGFDKRYFDLFGADWDKYFCLRVGWSWNDENPKMMEINSHTPVFWFEPEMGNRLLAQEFGLKNPHPKSEQFLTAALNEGIFKGLSKLSSLNNPEPLVGFVTCNFYEDRHVMSWLSSHCEFDYEIVTIENLDFTKKDNVPFSRVSKRPLDAIILWYPLEWLVDLKFTNGEKVWDVLMDALRQKNFALIHAIPAFFIQSKAILAYITENADRIFTGKLKGVEKYFPKTYLNSKTLGDTYFAKPIWGREGRGSFAFKKGEITRSRYQEDYYVKQPKVYQELLDLPKIDLEDKKLTIIYEGWVYRVGNELKPGSVGIRASVHPITDDYSYWIPIGV